MYTETEGIVLRQVKTVNERRMVLLFSQKYGKISAGTGINERSKGRAALAMRPFTYGRYDINKKRDAYYINSAEVIRAYYKIGEDVDKYMCASYVLELTDKLLEEEAPSPALFKLILDFFDVMERRKKKYGTLVMAFEIKAMQCAGAAPEVRNCVLCGKNQGLRFFSVKDGGLLCEECGSKNLEEVGKTSLIYEIKVDIIEILRYFLANPLKTFETIALEETVYTVLRGIIKNYQAYYLDVGTLKSENYLNN